MTKSKTQAIVTLIAATFTIVATTSGYAQFKAGIKAGLNVASLKGTYAYNESDKQKVGFHAGVTVEYSFANPNYALVGEVLYSTQGNIIDESQAIYQPYNPNIITPPVANSYLDLRTTLSISYVNVPIMLKGYVLDKLSIEGGPQFCFALKAEKEFEYTSTSDPTQNRSFTEDVLKDGTYQDQGATYTYLKSVKPFDVGINAGATYDITDSFYFQLHYYFGLTSAESRPANSYYTPNKNNFRNSVFQVSLGYKFF